jgi:hypothetical protein
MFISLLQTKMFTSLQICLRLFALMFASLQTCLHVGVTGFVRNNPCVYNGVCMFATTFTFMLKDKMGIVYFMITL